MKRLTRRQLLQATAVGAAAFAVPHLALSGRAAGANAEIRLGVIGLGGIKVPGSVGGRGRQVIDRFRAVPGVRMAALCDVDQAILADSVATFKGRGEQPATYADLRKLLDDKSLDAVAIATPNHWHALATIWACQAGKDVYVEKPFSYNIWEGRQMVAAARKYKRMVQVGTQRRSSQTLRQVVEFVRGGQLGAIRCAYALIYRARDGIGKVAAPTPVPETVNYDLWCGPGQMRPVNRTQFHYEWHWQWPEGNGEIGNNGAHHIDIARWALGHDTPPARAMSIGGRLGFDDDGETPNTQIAFFDYRPAPVVCEIRNYRGRKDAAAIGKFRGQSGGIIIDCEGGYVAGDMTGCTVFDTAGKEVKKISDGRKSKEQEEAHAANFVAAMRSRDHTQLNAEAQIGHVTATCCHMANVSHRLGAQASPEAIAAAVKTHAPLADAFDRCRAYLLDNGLDLHKTQATLGPWLTLDAEKEQFLGQFAEQANKLSRRAYREPFVVPELA